MKVVVCSEIQWRYVRTRKQQLLGRFPRDWPILFLQAYVRGRKNDWRPRSEGNVTWVTVPAFKSIPNRFLRWLLDLGAVRAAATVVLAVWVWCVRKATGFGGGDVGLFVSNIFYGRILRTMRRRFAIYDCNDNHLAFPGTPAWAEGYLKRVVRGVDAVVVSSPILREGIDPLRPRRVVEIGNGVDFELFEAARRAPRPPAEMASLARPRIGYAGALAAWIDFEFLLATARAFPSGTLVLVGPAVGPGARPGEFFAGVPNVRWFGSKPHDELPHWLAEMDVCLIPFRCNDLTRGVNPNKLYEYLALGKPVVSTEFSPFIREFGDLVRVAGTPEGFAREVAAALASPPQAELRRECARRHGWDASAERMVRLFEELAVAPRGAS